MYGYSVSEFNVFLIAEDNFPIIILIRQKCVCRQICTIPHTKLENTENVIVMLKDYFRIE